MQRKIDPAVIVFLISLITSLVWIYPLFSYGFPAYKLLTSELTETFLNMFVISCILIILFLILGFRLRKADGTILMRFFGAIVLFSLSFILLLSYPLLRNFTISQEATHIRKTHLYDTTKSGLFFIGLTGYIPILGGIYLLLRKKSEG